MAFLIRNLQFYIQVRHLLNEGTDVNASAWGSKSPGATALHLAAQGGHVKIMGELLERDANIDAQTKGACASSLGYCACYCILSRTYFALGVLHIHLWLN